MESVDREKPKPAEMNRRSNSRNELTSSSSQRAEAQASPDPANMNFLKLRENQMQMKPHQAYATFASGFMKKGKKKESRRYNPPSQNITYQEPPSIPAQQMKASRLIDEIKRQGHNNGLRASNSNLVVNVDSNEGLF